MFEEALQWWFPFEKSTNSVAFNKPFNDKMKIGIKCRNKTILWIIYQCIWISSVSVFVFLNLLILYNSTLIKGVYCYIYDIFLTKWQQFILYNLYLLLLFLKKSAVTRFIKMCIVLKLCILFILFWWPREAFVTTTRP